MVKGKTNMKTSAKNKRLLIMMTTYIFFQECGIIQMTRDMLIIMQVLQV